MKLADQSETEAQDAREGEREHLELRAYATSDDNHRAWIDLVRAYARSMERVARRAEAEGAVPPDWFDVLMALESAPAGHLSVGALGEHVALTRSGLTRLVDRIEAAGLIERQASANSRRTIDTVLTAKGREALRQNLPIYTRAIAQSVGNRYTPQEARQLRELLARQFAPD